MRKNIMRGLVVAFACGLVWLLSSQCWAEKAGWVTLLCMKTSLADGYAQQGASFLSNEFYDTNHKVEAYSDDVTLYQERVETVLDTQIGVYYMPCWSAGYFPAGWEDITDGWKRIKNFTPERRPLKGWYDDRNAAVVNQQLQEMSDNGIDFVAWDWFWNSAAPEDAPGQRGALDAYLASGYNNRVSYALTWDASATWNSAINPNSMPVPANLQSRTIQSLAEWEAMFRHIVNAHMKRPQYLTLENKPAFFIVNTQYFVWLVDYIAIREGVPLGAEREAFRKNILERARQIAREESQGALDGIYFVGQAENMMHWTQSVPKSYNFDAISAYNYHSSCLDGMSQIGPQSASYSELMEVYRQQWDYILTHLPSKENADGSSSVIPYFLPITAGWDKTPWKGGVTDPHDNCAPTAAEFRTHLEQARERLAAYPEATKGIGIICAWNEFGEGSYIEPSDKYGPSLLEQVGEVFGN